MGLRARVPTRKVVTSGMALKRTIAIIAVVVVLLGTLLATVQAATAAPAVPSLSGLITAERPIETALVGRGITPYLAVCIANTIETWDPKALPVALSEVRENKPAAFLAQFEALEQAEGVNC